MMSPCPPAVVPLSPLSGRIALRPGVQIVPLGVVDTAPVGAGRSGVLTAPSGRLALWMATSAPLTGCAVTVWLSAHMSTPPQHIASPRGSFTNALQPTADAHQIGDVVGELAHGPVSVDLVAAAGGARFVSAWLSVACLPDVVGVVGVAGGIISTQLYEPSVAVTHAPLSAVRELQSAFVDVESDKDSSELVLAGRSRRSAGVRVTLTTSAPGPCQVAVEGSHGGIEQAKATIRTGARTAYLALPDPRGQLRLCLQAAESVSALITVGCHG